MTIVIVVGAVLFLRALVNYNDCKSKIMNTIKIADEFTIKTADEYTDVESDKYHNLINYDIALEKLDNIKDTYTQFEFFLYKGLFAEADEKYKEKHNDYLKKKEAYDKYVNESATAVEEAYDATVKESSTNTNKPPVDGVISPLPEKEIWQYCKDRWEYYDAVEGKYSADKYTDDVFNDA